jgi:aminoglycoside phosphotransferase (APT) family kinase protein
MHEGQVQVALDALREAVANQLPQLAGQPVRPVDSAGTVIAPFRIGGSWVARVPLVPDGDHAGLDVIQRQGQHARELARALPAAVPQLVGAGRPFPGYDGTWSVWTWLPGTSLDRLLTSGSEEVDLDALAEDLAHLLRRIRALPAAGRGWSGNGRGGRPLADSSWVRTSIRRSSHLIDPRAATRIWETALAAPPHDGEPVRIHGDPVPGNLLVSGGRLSGLIDVSEPVVGDPAADLQPAWEILQEPQRSSFVRAMGLDEAAWQRGRGWAFEMAIGGLHYYEHTNPVFFRTARRTLANLLRTA